MSTGSKISSVLQRFGRPMTLRRFGPKNATWLDVTVNGVTRSYKTEELIGDIEQSDFQVTIADAQIAAAKWPGPPRKGDALFDAGRRYSVVNVETKQLGSEKLVHQLQVRG